MKETFDLSDLQMLARDCLTRAGVSGAVAQIVARDVALSEAGGRAEAGFSSLLRDIRLVRYGRLFPDAEVSLDTLAPAVIRVDAGHGFAAAAVAKALPLLVDTARAQGMAMLHLIHASDPGPLTGAMAEIAASGLAAVLVRPQGNAFAIRPMERQVSALDHGAQSMLAALMNDAPMVADSPLEGPVMETAWLTALDPGVTAAEELLTHLPDLSGTPMPGTVALAPELLAQIVNA